MIAPIMSFKQRNVYAKTELKLFPDYLEFNFIANGINDGFNAKYESLPGDFEFGTLRQKNLNIWRIIILVAMLLPLVLLKQRGDPAPIIGIALLVGFVLCLISAGVHWLFVNNYTVVPTQGRDILIVQDAQHDRIIDELRARRVSSLKKAVVVNRLENPWSEVKKFKFLWDEGIISENDFEAHKEMIFAPSDAKSDGPGNSPPLH